MLRTLFKWSKVLLHPRYLRILQIEAAMQSGKLDEAATIAAVAMAKYPRDVLVLTACMQVHAALEDWDKVITAGRHIDPTARVSAEVLLDAAKCLELAGGFAEAERIYRHLIEHQRNWPAALTLGYRKSRQGDADAAALLICDAILFGGKCAWPVAIPIIRDIETETAEACRQKLLAGQPNTEQPGIYYKLLSLFDERLGDSDQSFANMRTATQRDFAARHDAALSSEAASSKDDQPILRPRFLIIGAMKCGTTTLQNLIEQHPRSLRPLEKEIQFFQFPHLKDQWYLEHFPRLPANSGRFVGEASPGYYLFDVIERIEEVLPDVRLLFIQRDPALRAISHLRHNHRHGLSTNSVETVIKGVDQLEETLLGDPEHAEQHLLNLIFRGQRHNVFLVLGLYELLMRRWHQAFGPQRLKIIRLEDLQQSPQCVMDGVFKFLGVETTAVSLMRENRGDYVDTDLKTQNVLQRLRQFYERIDSALSTGTSGH